MYKELTQKDTDALERQKTNSIKKRNILKILKNKGTIFTSTYLHYGEVPKKTIVERSIGESVKLRRRRIAKIEEEEEENINYKLFNEYFTNYQSPSDMYKKLRATEGERNEDQVYVIKKVSNKMKKTTEKTPEDKKNYDWRKRKNN